MTEMETGSNAASEQGSTSSPTISGNSVSTDATSQNTGSQTERTFTQAEVNDIVGKAKSEAVQRLQRQTQQESSYSQPNQQYHSANNPNPAYGMSPEEIRRLAAEEYEAKNNEMANQYQQYAKQQQEQQVANEFLQRLESGKDKFSNYEAAQQEIAQWINPDMAALLNSVDNTVDVLAELNKDAWKLSTLSNSLRDNPYLARKQLQQLSETIKRNSEGEQISRPNEPLSQLKPSNQGMDNKGALTVADYKQKYIV